MCVNARQCVSLCVTMWVIGRHTRLYIGRFNTIRTEHYDKYSLILRAVALLPLFELCVGFSLGHSGAYIDESLNSCYVLVNQHASSMSTGQLT